MKRFPWLPYVIAGVSFLFFVVLSVRGVFLQRDLRRLEREQLARRQASVKDNSGRTQGIESGLSLLARKAGVGKLLGLSLRDGGSTKTLAIEWESTPSATMTFLGLLQSPGGAGTCLSLMVTPTDTAQHVRVRGIFEEKPSVSSGIKVLPLKLARNVFAPLWRDASVALAERQERERKREEQARVAEQQKSETDRRVQEEAQRQQEKKRGLESQLLVTGIVNNGREPLAFVSAPQGRSVMLRSGDVIEEARVTSIDQSKGEVRLDYQGKFEVVLRIQ